MKWAIDLVELWDQEMDQTEIQKSVKIVRRLIVGRQLYSTLSSQGCFKSIGQHQNIVKVASCSILTVGMVNSSTSTFSSQQCLLLKAFWKLFQIFKIQNYDFVCFDTKYTKLPVD